MFAEEFLAAWASTTGSTATAVDSREHGDERELEQEAGERGPDVVLEVTAADDGQDPASGP